MGVPFPARWRLVLSLVAGGCILAAASPTDAAGIGVVDFQLIFERFEGYEDAQRTFERELKEWEDEAQEKRSEIDALAAEIDSQRLMLSESRLAEKQDQLRRLRQEYESFAERIWSTNGKAAQRNAELTRPISEKVRDTIARIGEEKGLDLILDAGTGGVVWSKDDVNLTQTVLDELALSVESRAQEGRESPQEQQQQEGSREGGLED